MDNCLDTKEDNQEDFLDTLPSYNETETLDPVKEEQDTAPYRRVHNPTATAPTEIGLIPPSRHLTVNDTVFPVLASEYIVDARVFPVKEVVRVKKTTTPPLVRLSLIIPPLTTASVSVREAFSVVYQILISMAPDLTFQRNKKNLRCRGYFTHDFDTCAFEVQIWRVHPSFAVSGQPDEHICELRRLNRGGRDSFDVLLCAIAVGLECAGHAKRYASGFEIVPKLSIENEHDEYSMPGLESSSTKYPIRLDTDSVNRLTSIVAKRKYPLHSETLRLLAKCSAVSKENCELLRESDELATAVRRELNEGSEANACFNALKLIELGATAPNGVFPAVARSMLIYSGKKPSGYKGMRSQAIENAALGAMEMLIRAMQKEEREEVIRTIEKLLSGKLIPELFRKVQAICL